MPTTTNRGYRKPDLSYPPNVPADITRLADDLDVDVDTLRQVMQVTGAAPQPIPNNTATPVVGHINNPPGNPPNYLEGGITYTPANGQFVVSKLGLYRVEAAISWPLTAVVHRRVYQLSINGSLGPFMQQWDYTNATVPATELVAARTIKLAANDSVAVLVFHGIGSTVNVTPLSQTINRV